MAFMAAIRTCSVSSSIMRWFSPSRSRGMVASAFRVRSAMARLGPGVACVCSSGGRPWDGGWGGAPGRVMAPPPGVRQGGVVWRGGGPPRAGGRGVGPRV